MNFLSKHILNVSDNLAIVLRLGKFIFCGCKIYLQIQRKVKSIANVQNVFGELPFGEAELTEFIFVAELI